MAKEKKRGGLGGAILSLAVVLGLAGGAGGTDDVGSTEVYETTYMTESEIEYVLETEEQTLANYVEVFQIQTPKSSVDCEGENYTEIVRAFEEAGFVNVEAYSKEIEYTTKILDETVAEVSVGGTYVFQESEAFNEDAPVEIFYYVILPEETEVKKQESVPTNENIVDENKAESNVSGESEIMVWIPQSGSKYHKRSSCSNMKNPTQVTKEEAIDKGYNPCKKCYK